MSRICVRPRPHARQDEVILAGAFTRPGIALLRLPRSLICPVLIHLSSCQSCFLSLSSCTTTHSFLSSLALPPPPPPPCIKHLKIFLCYQLSLHLSPPSLYLSNLP